MKKRILGSLITMGLAATLVGGATFALFSDTATNTNNVFATGTLDINTQPASGTFNASNIVPGYSETKTIKVLNDGTVNFNYNIAAQKQSGDDVLYNALTLTIDDNDPATPALYNGLVKDLNAITLRALANGSNEDLTFTVGLPSAADNTVAGKTATVEFDFAATQQ